MNDGDEVYEICTCGPDHDKMFFILDFRFTEIEIEFEFLVR